MLLKLTATHTPVTDLGLILHNPPDQVQTYQLPFGSAHVFYPEANVERSTVALLLELDPVALAHRNGSDPRFHDRPYVASALLSVVLGEVFAMALAGICEQRPELVEQVLPLTVELPVVRLQAADLDLSQRLFEPLGYQVSVEPITTIQADYSFGYGALKLSANLSLKQLLAHIYVLIPVLDNASYDWIGSAEVAALLAKAESWLAHHPEGELIKMRYLRYQKSQPHAALEQLGDVISDQAEPDYSLIVRRLKAVGAQKVLDLGCGAGKLLRKLLNDSQFKVVVGMDLSIKALTQLQHDAERLPEQQRQRLSLLHGSLLYRDARLKGFDAAVIVDVFEQLDPSQLPAFEAIVFGFARPKFVLLARSNREQRFEWTSAKFVAWAEQVTAKYNYRVTIEPLGAEVADHGAVAQLGVFEDAN